MFRINFLNLPRLFEGILNRKNRNRQNLDDIFKGISENCDIEMPKFDRVVGKPVKADNKIIYPIIEIAAMGNKMQNFKGLEIFPIAVVIEEAGEKYAISLTDEEIDSNEFIEMIKK